MIGLNDLGIEQALLGALLINSTLADTLSVPLEPSDFQEPAHGRVWSAIQSLRAQDRTANPTTLRQYFEHDPALQDVGGFDYFKTLTSAAITTSAQSLGDYSEILRDLRQRRELVQVCQSGIQHANDPKPGETAETVAEAIHGGTMRAIQTTAEPDSHVSAIMQDVLQEAEKSRRAGKTVPGVSTHLKDLDARLGGFRRGQLVILGGRPGMGKSALAGHISFAAARQGVPTLVVSLEMTRAEWMQRVVSARIDVPYDDIRRGQLDDNQFLRLTDMSARISRLPLHVVDREALTVAAIRNRAMRMKAQGGLGLVIVDYLGFVKPEDRYRGNKVNETGEISGALKAMAKSLDIPVICLAQLNRGNESRDDKRPNLADLRNSGDIEQDADVVMFVYREAYYLNQKEPTVGTPEHHAWGGEMQKIKHATDIIIAKNRHGTTGTVRVFGDMATTRYLDLVQ